MALTCIIHRILSFLDSPGAVRLLMIDFRKAFDQLPHNSTCILNALTSSKAPKELFSWVSSYLDQRWQCVNSNGCFSNWYLAKSGVPQGGVLSPLLFALAIDSLEAQFDNSFIMKFADDVCLLHFLRDDEDNHLSEEFACILSWSSERGLCVNREKTKLMNFQTKASISPPVLVVAETAIEVVKSARLLGLTIESNFSWKLHVSQVLSKARKRIFMLHSLSQANAPKSILWMAYCSLVRSILCYAFPAWCNIGKCNMRSLIQLENRICRRFQIECEIGFDTFCQSIAQKLFLSILKCDSHPLSHIFSANDSRKTRISRRFCTPMTRTKRFSNSFIKFCK